VPIPTLLRDILLEVFPSLAPSQRDSYQNDFTYIGTVSSKEKAVPMARLTVFILIRNMVQFQCIASESVESVGVKDGVWFNSWLWRG